MLGLQSAAAPKGARHGPPRAIPQRRKSPAGIPPVPSVPSLTRKQEQQRQPRSAARRSPSGTPRNTACRAGRHASNTSHTARHDMGPPLASPGTSRPAKPGKHSRKPFASSAPCLPRCSLQRYKEGGRTNEDSHGPAPTAAPLRLPFYPSLGNAPYAAGAAHPAPPAPLRHGGSPPRLLRQARRPKALGNS
jgi:hypothetical protein